jgi:hypothetical protein
MGHACNTWLSPASHEGVSDTARQVLDSELIVQQNTFERNRSGVWLKRVDELQKRMDSADKLKLFKIHGCDGPFSRYVRPLL